MARSMGMAVACLFLAWSSAGFAAEPTGAAPRAGPTVKVTEHAAAHDGKTLDTAAFQKAIDACSQAGGGVVEVPSGSYAVGTIELKSHVTLHLAEGATILGSTKLDDYRNDVAPAMEALKYSRCVVYARDASDIAITGSGTIDGRGTKENFPTGNRAMLCRFVSCRDVTIKGVTLKDAGAWCTQFVLGRNIVLDHVTIHSQVNGNNDGFDLDSCQDVLVTGCTITTGDDAVCLKSATTQPCRNITVTGCTMSSHHAGFKTGTSSKGGFIDITVKDCTFSDCGSGAIKLCSVDGGVMRNVLISDVAMKNVGGPIFVRLGARNMKFDTPGEMRYSGKADENIGSGTMSNIVIRNIKAEVTQRPLNESGILITGMPGQPIRNLVLENIEVVFKGGGKEADAKAEVPERTKGDYPEQSFFGTLPAWGLFLRHAEGVMISNVKLSLKESDARPAVMADDVKAVVVKQLDVAGGTGAGNIRLRNAVDWKQ